MDWISSETSLSTRDGVSSQIGLLWQQVRAPLLVPFLRIMVVLCLVMSLMLFLERVYMGIVIAFIKVLRRKPEKKYKWEPVKDDLELANYSYPMVLVQIPMYNEREVYQLSIGAACNLSWPADRILIQVLDDSTDPTIKAMVEQECRRWAGKGVNIKYEIRDNRKGYKAGALKEGMKHNYVKMCDYVAIFDADFQPDSDFLMRTIPFLVHNPEVGLVKNELPSTFKAYRYQQHRWSCGPANLFRKMAVEIAANKKVSLWKKCYLIYSFFFVRKIVAHIVTFIFYCVVMPATVLIPEVQVPIWGAVYIPSTITLLNAVGTPRSLHLLVFWILFENVMSLHRTRATFIGLFEVGRVNEWVVTEKLGDALKTKMSSKASKKDRFRIGERYKLHFMEIFVGLYLLFCGWYDYSFGKNRFYIYLFLQSMAFFAAGFGYIGVFVPNS
ncbi:glucomannan 4-beta-mannosyltransferase 9 [Nicotiana attenuata]|uniref:Glucomannan 4-beta-mannosyltransferase 9 n=1 Tax=Nicotiana attenuata TaxID=49451 RepID=A0A1J6IFV4_NICAT|nr:glucomannan 4-beta-mannosyltransferase 9 [Nicotiana attenuata]